jgi:hypothetical protein
VNRRSGSDEQSPIRKSTHMDTGARPLPGRRV